MKYKMKKFLKSLLLDVIQMALLLALMVYSQVIAMRVMITCFPDDARKGTFVTFIAVFLFSVLCAVMLWMVLLIVDRYKVMLFGDSFPTFWNCGKPTTKKLEDCVAHIPPPPMPVKYENSFFKDKAPLKWHGADDPCVDERFVIAAFYHSGENLLFCHYYPNWMEMQRDQNPSNTCKLVAWTSVESLNKSALETDFIRGEVSAARRYVDIKKLRGHGM